MADDDEDLPHVVNGQLSKPYPIRSKADVNRALVLPPPAAERPVARPAAKKPTPKAPADDEQPKSGFDYVVKRNRMLKRISGRAGRRARTVRA